MSADPNGNRWSNAENNIGKTLLKRSGWTEGSGLGKEQDGVVSHVKVSRKDDVTGLGYKAGVAEAWSTQSVGFADVLDRIKNKTLVVNDSDDDDIGSPTSAAASSPTDSKPSSPTESRHYKMYAKRNALKTELLRGGSDSREKRAEILGSASSTRRRGRESGSGTDDDDDSDASDRKRAKSDSTKSTLVSPLLTRLMMRVHKDEPKPTVAPEEGAEIEEKVKITKPNPRPPKCTETPFVMS